MAIFKCDSCDYERDVPDKLVGKRAKCPDCGHGVTILDQPPDTEPLFDVEFEEESVPNDDSPLLDTDMGDGHPFESIDLDNEDVEIALDGPEDVLCTKCGAVTSAGEEVCPRCGEPLESVETIPPVDESDIDVSDLAEEQEPQIWDAEFQSEKGTETIEPVESHEWSFFKGSFTLNIFGGAVSGVLLLFFVYALCLLATSQSGTREFLPYLLGMGMAAVFVGGIINSLFSRIPFSLVGPETVPIVVLLLFMGNIQRSMESSFTDEHILPTILAGIVLTAILTGLILWLIGRFRVGEYIRYIPLQIIGGVVGGVGVFVLVGTMDLMGNMSLDWTNMETLGISLVRQFHPASHLGVMGPSLAFGIILFLAMWRSRSSLLLLAMLLTASCAGYAAGVFGSEDILSLASPVNFSGGPVLVHPFEVFRTGGFYFDNIQWHVIQANSLYIGALAALSVLAAMYRTTKLEILRGRENDLNVEYKSLGLSNMLSGLFGGMPVALSHGRSAGNYAAGARGPLSGIMAAVLCAVALFYAEEVLPLIPRFVPQGLLIYIGLDMIRSWMLRTRTAFTRSSELWMLRVAFLVTIGLGLLEGIGFGVALALVISVARASQGGVIRNVLSGAGYTSNVDRASAQQRTLKEFGDHIYILRLQGFFFLGAMEQLLKDIRTRLDDRNQLPVEYLILDFKRVTGFASAAGVGFVKMRNLADEYGVEFVFTSAPLELEEHLAALDKADGDDGPFKVFFNLDYALEWCENRVLDAENMLEMKELTLPELLVPVFPEPEYIPALMKILKRQVVQPGEAVFRQGDKSDAMYFVESGRLDVELEMESGKILRLKKVGPGAVFGEMGIYTLAPRSATIRAAEKCVVYRMTLEKLDAVEKRAPMLVTSVNRFLINMLSERLADANAKVRDLML